MELASGAHTACSRPSAFSVDFTPIREILSKYVYAIGINFDYDEYLYSLGWFFFSEHGKDFSQSVCRTMLMDRKLPELLIYEIEHEVCAYAGSIMDDLLLAYDQCRALNPNQLHSSRCILLPGSVFTVIFTWEEVDIDELRKNIRKLYE